MKTPKGESRRAWGPARTRLTNDERAITARSLTAFRPAALTALGCEPAVLLFGATLDVQVTTHIK